MQKESSEEAGPSNLNTIPSPLNHRRQATLNSRIHFPAESQNPKTHKTSKSIADGAVVGSPKDGSSSRRRVVSVDAGNGVSKSSVRRRIPTVSLGSSAQMVASLHSNESKDSDWSTFSDEYDLYPRILQDVQRALKLKYRREARARSPLHSGPSPSPPSSPPTLTFPIPSSPRSKVNAVKPSATDIDFSPSTGPASLKVVTHPVPFSTDDGDTLDWSGYLSDDERSEKRWSLSVSKKKGKEREMLLSADDLKKQEGLHAAKLARIKTISSQLTAKKVAITTDQLSRRYNLIYSSLSSGSDRFNLLKVSRWYGEQEVLVRSSLEKAEPFPWLKHLDKRSRKQSGNESVRIPWHLSALIMEEYLHAQNARNHAMQSIPEHPSISDSLEDLTSPFLISPPPEESTGLPTFPSPSRASSSRFSLSRHISAEGRVSFEPLLDPPTRPSNESRRSVESTLSSIFSAGSAQNQTSKDRQIGAGFSSPASSKLHLRDGLGIRRKWGNDSDGSSARNSLAEQSDDNVDNKSDQGGDNNNSKRSSWRFGRTVGVESPPAADNGGDDSFVQVDENDLSIAKPPPPPATAIPAMTVSPNSGEVPLNGPRIINRNIRPIRVSLPSEDRIALALKQKRKQEADEARADMEYDLKSQLLAQCKDSNTHIRSVLNRIATHIREYETCQSSFVTNTLGLPYKGGLPQELLEAFSHDPANVTSSTRRMKTYKAVDDIHHRLTRQRTVFREFLEKNGAGSEHSSRGGGNDGFPVTKDILNDPIESLMRSLKMLEGQRMGIVKREQEVSEVLRQTQVLHKEVKVEYNSTLAHTSVVYPELTKIVGLEESYKDQYQHLWDIGMDALTFILDSVTPFWRTYGKLIGDDVQAFLIVPLYRNEFTGEAKRYPIAHLPQRSFRHWVGLLMFFILTIVVMFLQARAALSCSVHYRLEWIPFDGVRWAALPLFWVGIVIQWLAVLGELAILVMQVGMLMWWVGWSVRLVS